MALGSQTAVADGMVVPPRRIRETMSGIRVALGIQTAVADGMAGMAIPPRRMRVALGIQTAAEGAHGSQAGQTAVAERKLGLRKEMAMPTRATQQRETFSI